MRILSELTLCSASSDDGIKHLTSLTLLTVLKLQSGMYGEVAMKHVSRIRSLEVVDLRGCEVQGEGIKWLKHMHKLRHVMLDDTMARDQASLGFDLPRSLLYMPQLRQ